MVTSMGQFLTLTCLTLNSFRRQYYLDYLMNTNTKLAFGILLATSIWMLTGYLKAEDSSKEAKVVPKELFKVQAAYSYAQAYSAPISIRAHTEAERTLAVAAEVEGLVVALPQKEGSRVKKGDVLCELDKEDRQLRVSQAKAQLAKANIDYEGALKLKNSGFQSSSQIAAAKSGLELARAESERAQIALQKTQVIAPFDGFLERLLVEEGGFLQRGNACARLLELDPIIVVGNVSELEVSQIKLDATASVSFQDGFVRDGTLRYISAAPDAMTRSYRVEIELDNKDFQIISGLTVSAQVKSKETQAHLISPSLLSLMDSGQLGLSTVDENGIVSIKPVSILGDDEKGVWVAGLPESINLITIGQQYVSHGQHVDVTVEENSQNSIRQQITTQPTLKAVKEG